MPIERKERLLKLPPRVEMQFDRLERAYGLDRVVKQACPTLGQEMIRAMQSLILASTGEVFHPTNDEEKWSGAALYFLCRTARDQIRMNYEEGWADYARILSLLNKLSEDNYQGPMSKFIYGMVSFIFDNQELFNMNNYVNYRNLITESQTYTRKFG